MKKYSMSISAVKFGCQGSEKPVSHWSALSQSPLRFAAEVLFLTKTNLEASELNQNKDHKSSKKGLSAKFRDRNAKKALLVFLPATAFSREGS
jgi:hypothetical protein